MIGNSAYAERRRDAPVHRLIRLAKILSPLAVPMKSR